MTRDAQRFGKAAELAAEQFLRQRGYSILDRNVRFPNGEIDLVAGWKDSIIFVEVKARRTLHYGGAVYAISRWKQQRLVSLAAQYLSRRGLSDRPCRFDVILIQGDHAETQHVQHLEQAFDVPDGDRRW